MNLRWNIGVQAAVFACAFSLTSAVRADGSAAAFLSLDAVLRSVSANHPLLMAERAVVDAAHGEARAARGDFEPILSAQARAMPSGYYDGRRLDVLIEQPTPWLGATVYGGYRISAGKIAPYYGEQRTLSRGELRAGARLPLLYERALDPRRAALLTTDAQAEAAGAGYRERLLALERAATRAYYGWVAAGQKLRVGQELVALAVARGEKLDELVALGATAALEAVDNRRAMIERQRNMVGARRALEQAAIDLSMYVRTPDGAPNVVSPDALPPELAPPAFPYAVVEEAEARALAVHPELSVEAAQVEMAAVEHALARARVAPRFDVLWEVSRDLGEGDPSLVRQQRPTTVEVGASLSLPASLLRARKKRDAAAAKLEAAKRKAQYAADGVRAEVRDAYSQLAAARERIALAAAARDAAEEVARGERERFALGGSNVLFVNLREQQAGDAATALIDAIVEGHVAAARTRLAEGRTLLSIDATSHHE